MKNIIITLFAGLECIFLSNCSTAGNSVEIGKSKNTIECDNVACDTITTYKLFHLIGADTVVYDYTYKDTVHLNSNSGDIVFENNRCQSCKGTQKVYVLNQENKVIDSVSVIHNGDAVSEKIALKRWSRNLPGVLKIAWEGFGGRAFYLHLN